MVIPVLPRLTMKLRRPPEVADGVGCFLDLREACDKAWLKLWL